MSRPNTALSFIVERMLRVGCGILAADESTGTIGKRFAGLRVENNEDNRRSYRELLFSAREAFLSGISGVITYEESLFQKMKNGKTFPEALSDCGAVVGIKVDKGTIPLPMCSGEVVTQGLDGLPDRLKKYRAAGAEFAKWRAVLSMGADGSGPSQTAISAAASGLASYAAFVQDAGMVPIVEPELLTDGSHDIVACSDASERILRAVFAELIAHRVSLEGIVLKPNMVTAGSDCSQPSSADDVASSTLTVLRRTVPAAVGGIAFLSGGQSEIEATRHLNLMNADQSLPWRLTFSYGRALQAAALKEWNGRSENTEAAQKAFIHRAKMNGLASTGKWRPELEIQ